MKVRGRGVVNRRRQRRYSVMGHRLTSLGPRNGPFPSLPASEQTQIRKGLLLPAQQRGWSLIPLLESGKNTKPGPTRGLLFSGDDDGGASRFPVLLQGHVQAEQVLGVLTCKPLQKRHCLH